MKLKIKGAFHPCLSLKSSAVPSCWSSRPSSSSSPGQGLAGAINGGVGGANNARLTPADQMLAKVTRIAGIVFFVVAILACVFASRLA